MYNLSSSLFFFFFKEIHVHLFIYLCMTVLRLHFCARALSSRGKWGPLFIAVRGPLTIAASPAAEHRLQTRRLSNCGSRAQPLRGTRDPPRPGPEPVSPALAGRLSTTAPPGKPSSSLYTWGHYSPDKKVNFPRSIASQWSQWTSSRSPGPSISLPL